MDKRVILAVAGAGKTHYLCHNLNPNKKNLILAFTHSNIFNIKRELINAYKGIPELTTIMTFDSFVYRYMICPYEPTILRYFHKSDFKTHNVTLKSPPVKVKKISGKYIPNPLYKRKNQFEHYVNKNGQYYCATMSELLLYVKEGKNPILKRITENINKFYDQIMIDEFQDFRNYDFEIVQYLIQSTDNIVLVGDYYQHSVSAVNNSGKPFDKTCKTYSDFKNLLSNLNVSVDDTTLIKSRRCSKNICNYVKDKLKIDIYAYDDRLKGQVIIVEDNVDEILSNNQIVKLIYEKSKIYTFNAINWSYSKGDTLDDVCLILTKTLDSLVNDDFDLNKISEIMRNKLYVAMTRTRGNLYILQSKIFNQVSENYKKSII